MWLPTLTEGLLQFLLSGRPAWKLPLRATSPFSAWLKFNRCNCNGWSYWQKIYFSTIFPWTFQDLNISRCTNTRLCICQVKVTPTTTCLGTSHLNASAQFIYYILLLLAISKWCLGHLRKHIFSKQKSILLNRKWRNSLYTQPRISAVHDVINL